MILTEKIQNDRQIPPTVTIIIYQQILVSRHILFIGLFRG